MRKEEYIREVVSQIQNKKARAEVERELSAHIDDRISYYTDAGWDEQAATEKAMAHMGKPKKVAEQMGKIHNSFSKKAAFIGALIILFMYMFLEIGMLKLTDFGANYWYEIVIRDYIILLVLIIMTIIAYCFNGKLLKILLLFEGVIAIANLFSGLSVIISSGIGTGAGYYIFENLLACVLVSLLAYLTFYSCRKGNREVSKNEKQLLFIITLIICSLYLITFFLFFGAGILNEISFTSKLPKETVELNLPQDTYLEDEYSLINYKISHDEETGAVGNYGTWYSEKGYFKPTKKVSDESMTWILNDNKNFLIVVYGNSTDGASCSFYVQEGILKFHDFRTAEFSDVKIRNVDVFDVFTEDELELFRQTIKVYNGNNFDIDYSTVPDEELDYPIDEYQTKDPIIISKSKVKDIYSFNWYFNGLEGIYLNRGVVVELTDGRLIVAHNCIEGYNGYYLRDKALELTGETKTKMQNVLLQVTEPEYEFDKYELAKEMVESVSN